MNCESYRTSMGSDRITVNKELGRRTERGVEGKI